MERIKYKIVETECFPCKWKCEIQPPHGPDNSTHLYHRSEEEALQWIIDHNRELVF